MQTNQSSLGQAPKAPEQVKAKAAKAPEQGKAYTKPGYEVPEAEAGNVHVVIERMLYNPHTGKKVSSPVTQILDPQMWNLCRKAWGAQGWTFVEALHLPAGCPDGFEAQAMSNEGEE